MKHLTTKGNLGGQLEIIVDNVEHSQSIKTIYEGFETFMKNQTKELHTQYAFNTVFVDYTEKLIDQPTVKFNATKYRPLYQLAVWTLKDFGECLLPNLDRKSGDTRLYAPKEWISAFQGIGVTLSMDLFAIGNSHDQVDSKGRKYLDFMDMIGLLEFHDIIERAGKFWYNMGDMNDRDSYLWDKFMENPESFVVDHNHVHKKQPPAGESIPAASVGTLTEELAAHYTRVRPKNLHEAKSRMFSLYSRHGRTAGDKQLLLTSYKLIAGLDDYDIREVMTHIERAIPGAHSTKQVEHLIRLAASLNYSGQNECQYYYYGNQQQEKIQETLDKFGITKQDLVVHELAAAQYEHINMELSRVNLQNFFTLEVV